MAVCARTFERFTRPPYADELIAIEPHEPVAEEDREPMNCRSEQTRDPRVTKGQSPRETHLPGNECCGGASCC